MSNTLRLSKKVLTYAVVAATILWSVGFAAIAAPLAASAADTTVTLTAGDSIQNASSKAVFYYSADGKRYTYPTGSVYLSWYSNWNGVKKISDAQMGGIAIGGTVAYRPGTRLVKIATAPATYAVEPGGTIRQIPDEATAVALFGSKWNKMIDDVDPSIFPYVYKIGTALATGEYPNGAVVKDVAGDVWLIGAGKTKVKVTSAGQTANWVQSKFVVSTTVDLSGYPAGTEVTAKVDSWTTIAGSGAPVGTGTTPPVVTSPIGTGLTVALNGTQPAAATIVTDSADGAQSLIPALDVNFTASADGDVKVKTVAVTRGGVSADTDVVAMFLYDGETQVGSSPSIATKKFTFTNSGGLFTVAKGTTKKITVKFDLLNAGSAGKVINLSLAASADVVSDGAVVNGSFPLASNNFTTAAVTDLGKFTLTNISPTAAANVNAGSTGYEVWRLQAVTQDQDVELRKVKFTVVGSVNVGDLKNFGLWDGAKQIGATVAEMAADKTITIDVTVAPYVFAKGVTRTLSLKADVIGGSTRTFRTSIQGAGDLVVYDKGYGVFLKHAGSDTFTVLQPNDGAASPTAVSYTVSTGTLSVTVATDSPTGNVASSTTAVTLGKFNFVAAGEDVKVTSLVVNCSDSTNTKTIKNLKILWDGSQVGSTVATSAACDGLADNTFTLGSTMIARVGKTSVLTVQGDITGTTTSGETLSVNVETGSSNATTLTSLTTLNTGSGTGRTLTIAAGTVSVSLNSSFGNKSSTNPTGTINAAGVKLGSFVITGGAGEDADVSQIALVDVSTALNLNTYTQNVKLMHNGVQIAPTLASPASAASAVQTHTFNVSPSITVPAGGQYVVDVVADLKATQTSAAAIITTGAITASGHTTGTSANYSTAVTLQQSYIASAGGLAITISSDTPLPTNLLMGATDQTLAKFQFTASSTEPINITQLVLSSAFTSAATGTLKNVRLYDDAGTLIGTVAGFDATQASNTNSTGTFAGAKFTGLSLVIPAGVTKVITVKADLANYVDLGVTTTGQAFKLAFLTDYDGPTAGFQLPVTGTGGQSGVALATTNTYLVAATESVAWNNSTTSATAAATALPTAGVSTNAAYIITDANEFVLYRTKLTIAWDATTFNQAAATSGNSAQIIGKFVVSNAANAGSYAATLDNLNFTISTTLSITATNTAALNVYKDSLSTTALATTTFAAGEVSGQTGSTYTAFNTAFDWAVETASSNSLTDTEIAAGGSKTIFVTLDTSNMTGASQSTRNLTLGIAQIGTGYSAARRQEITSRFGMVWSDNGVNSNTGGGISNIVASDNLLPLLSKTWTYSF